LKNRVIYFLFPEEIKKIYRKEELINFGNRCELIKKFQGNELINQK